MMVGFVWSCLAFAFALFLTNEEVKCQTDNIVATIKSNNNISWTEDFYVSVTMDSAIFPLEDYYAMGLDLSSPKFQTLLTSLKPAILRIGGTPADYIFFNKPLNIIDALGLDPDLTAVYTKEEFSTIVNLTIATGLRLLWDLNLALRFGHQWGPSNAIELFNYCAEMGYGANIDWELGNEAERYGMGIVNLTTLTAETVAGDFKLLHTLIAQYPGFADSNLLGPDVGVPSKVLGTEIIIAVANLTGTLLRGLTFHHYYFNAQTATVDDYLDPINFPELEDYIAGVQESVATTQNPNIDLWLGETSDAYNHGTPGVSDRFASGFLWMDKLGLAAKMGVRVVMRQSFYGYDYALLNAAMDPNPDYWITYLHNRLVGQKVLDVTLSPEQNTTAPITRAYAHCTNLKTGSGYPIGTVTFFALNVDRVNSKTFTFSAPFNNQDIDAFILTPDGTDGVLSSYVLLNGMRLQMVNDVTMPVLRTMNIPAGNSIVLPSLSLGYFVFRNANLPLCMS